MYYQPYKLCSCFSNISFFLIFIFLLSLIFFVPCYFHCILRRTEHLPFHFLGSELFIFRILWHCCMWTLSFHQFYFIIFQFYAGARSSCENMAVYYKFFHGTLKLNRIRIVASPSKARNLVKKHLQMILAGLVGH